MAVLRTTFWGLVASLTLFSVGLAQESTTTKTETTVNETFVGKALFVHLRNPGRSTVSLEDPRIQTFGLHTFLIGRTSDWPAKSLRVWVPLSDVSEIEEFADVKEMAKWYRVSPSASK
jgi:hypothetical protein